MKFLVILSVMLFALIDLQVDALYYCGPHWHLYNHRCFRLIRDQKTWFKAREYCVDEGQLKEAHMGVIKDAATQSFLEKNVFQSDKGSNIWIGLDDLDNEGQYIWHDAYLSILSGYTNWAAGQPNNYKNQDCVHIWGNHLFKWTDGSCTDLYHFLCEKPAVDTCKLATELSGDHGVIQSYNYPNDYLNNDHCRWTISVPEGFVIKLKVHKPFYLSLGCSDYLKVYEIGSKGEGVLKAKWCYNYVPPTFTSKTSKIMVEFKTDETFTRNGFSATWSKVVPKCGGTFPATTDSGIIMTPNYPLLYTDNENCKWTIDVDEGYLILITFSSPFDLVTFRDCSTDNVTIYDVQPNGKRTTSVVLCGKKVPPPVLSKTSKVEVEFKTRSWGRYGKGFSATWTKYVKGNREKLNGENGNVLSPNYPSTYPRNSRNEWEIVVKAGQTIALDFVTFDLGKNSDKSCATDKIEVFDVFGNDSRISRGEWCGSDVPPQIKSFGHSMIVEFHSDHIDGNNGQGFSATWKAVDSCGDVFNANQGYLMSYDFPRNGGSNKNKKCTWEINAERGFKINLQFNPSVKKSFCKDFEIWDNTIINNQPEFIRRPGWCKGDENQVVSLYHRMRLVFHPSKDDSIGFFASWNSVCGDVLEGTSGTFSSPYYKMGHYPPNLDCEWKIKGQDNRTVNLHFQSPFGLESSNGDDCNYDYVEVFESSLDGTLVSKGRFCGSRTPPPFVSSSSTLVVRFHSDQDKTSRGFNALWDTACGGVHRSNHGKLTSPGFPLHYPDNSDCRWEIHADDGSLIKLSFKQPFDLKAGSSSSDYIQVFDVSESGALIKKGQWSGQAPPATQTSATNKMVVVFHSDSKENGAGFQAVWDADCGEVFDASEGSIASPGYPDKYYSSLDCRWEINVNRTQKIKLIFNPVFDIEIDANCDYDYVEVLDYYPNGTEFRVGKMCGNKKPLAYTSSSSRLAVHFHSDKDKSGKGFNVTWETYMNNDEKDLNSPKDAGMDKNEKDMNAPMETACPIGWTQNGTVCFKAFEDIKRTWYEARNHCISLGGNLVNIDNFSRHEAINQLTGKLRYWIGLHHDNTGSFTWMDGSKPTFTLWRFPPRNLLGNEGCVELIGNHGGQWNDKPCGEKRYCICEIDAF